MFFGFNFMLVYTLEKIKLKSFFKKNKWQTFNKQQVKQ